MSKGKWGESFLKSGLPLEHLTLMTLRSLGWSCYPHITYERKNREGQNSWFELDSLAIYDKENNNTQLSFLIECKYHDLSRFWFFLPYIKSALDSDKFSDDSILNIAPLQTLANPRNSTFLNLAPTSSWGIVVSEDGSKQDNAVNTAIQQLANGFVPHCMDMSFASYMVKYHVTPFVQALIPMIVTNAKIYILKQSVSDLDVIRNATSPEQIADETQWTWCYFQPSELQLRNNFDFIDEYKKDSSTKSICKFSPFKERMYTFALRPQWILIINIKSLENAINTITSIFMSLPTKKIHDILMPQKDKQKKTK